MSQFVTVASADDVDPGEGTVVEADGTSVALFNVDGEFHAIGNDCTHMGGPLGEGSLADSTVTCPWHGAEFDVTSGAACGSPADGPVTDYEVRVEDGDVEVRV